MSRPRYLEDRAIEMITEAQKVLDDGHSVNDYHRLVNNAISLLALARAVRS